MAIDTPRQDDANHVSENEPRRPGTQNLELHRPAFGMRKQRAYRRNDYRGGRGADRDMGNRLMRAAQQREDDEQRRYDDEPAANAEYSGRKAGEKARPQQRDEREAEIGQIRKI